MPSSLIIVALAVAWLVVLVPMIAKKRQQVAHTADSALAARVVRSGGSARSEVREEGAMAETAGRGERAAVGARADDTLADRDHAERHGPDGDDIDGYDDAYYEDEYDDYADEYDEAGYDEYEYDEYDGAGYDGRGGREPAPRSSSERDSRRYRPGRGGFDPEAADIAARAKYAFRQRVVLGLLVAAVVAAIVAGMVATPLWWAHGAADLGLIGYLAYLRRQVRIENEIRQRRLQRLSRPASGPGREPVAAYDNYDGPPGPAGHGEYLEYDADGLDEEEHAEPEEEGYFYDYPSRQGESAPAAPITDGQHEAPGTARKPMPRAPKPSPSAVVLDVEDEDPTFHELGEPGEYSHYRKAVGE